MQPFFVVASRELCVPFDVGLYIWAVDMTLTCPLHVYSRKQSRHCLDFVWNPSYALLGSYVLSPRTSHLTMEYVYVSGLHMFLHL